MRRLAFVCTIFIFNLELFSPAITAGIIFGFQVLGYLFTLRFPLFYSKNASKFFQMQSFILLWFSAAVFLPQITGKLLNNSFLAFLVCVPMICLIFYFKNPIDDQKTVLLPFEEIHTASELVNKLEGMRYYFFTRNWYESSDLMTEKILSSSHDSFSLEEKFDLYTAAKARKCDRYIITERNALMNLINILYSKGLKK